MNNELSNFLEDLYEELKECSNDRTFMQLYNNTGEGANKTFTEKIMSIITESQCFKRLKYSDYQNKKEKDDSSKQKFFQKEYYRIDLVTWQHIIIDIEKESKINLYNWKLDIAIEHENNWQEWIDEVIKLLYINCPVRIVIGYNEETGRDEEDRKALSDLSKILNYLYKEEKIKFLEPNQKFGIILGNGHTKSKAKDADYRLYKIRVEKEQVVIEKYDNKKTNDNEKWEPFIS